MSITLIWSSAQPSAIARPRRSYWRTADSVLWENLTDRGLPDIQQRGPAQVRGANL